MCDIDTKGLFAENYPIGYNKMCLLCHILDLVLKKEHIIDV